MGVYTIKQLQGDSLESKYEGDFVTTQGIVTAVLRKGFYIQTPNTEWDGLHSDAIFVYGGTDKVKVGYWVQTGGEMVNYRRHENAKPVTQLKLKTLYLIEEQGASIASIPLTQALLDKPADLLAATLNSLEGMLVTLPAGATFVAPSNNFGDYVCALPYHFNSQGNIATAEKGLIITPQSHTEWLPGFRVRDYQQAKQLNVGARLLSDITGPLHYRADSWQIAASDTFEVDDNPISLKRSRLEPSDGALTVLTLNGFNLDAHIEAAEKVNEPRLDIDNDWGEGRFHTLAQAIALQANCPDIIALQEIQDNDGAELTGTTDASRTYKLLIYLLKELTGKIYSWADIPPAAGADGGQPGGNIRNGFLYNTERVSLDPKSLQLIGEDEHSFRDSRKALAATFTELTSQQSLTVINVHLASKRQQNSIFSPSEPGVDPRDNLRIAQAEVIYQYLQKIATRGQLFYVTGDFNDHEHSATLATFTHKFNTNLVDTLPPEERYDYNHRGKLQVLMHGIIPTAQVEAGKVDYEIIHGNELIGVDPGAISDKPSDHAYVIAKITF